jgi:hypothetical protein
VLDIFEVRSEVAISPVRLSVMRKTNERRNPSNEDSLRSPPRGGSGRNPCFVLASDYRIGDEVVSSVSRGKSKVTSLED